MISLKDKIILIILCATTITAIISYFYAFEIYTFAWHVVKRNPIIWNDLSVRVPDDLVAIMKIPANQEECRSEGSVLHIYYAKDQDRASILFQRVTFRLAKQPEKQFDYSGYRVLEKNDCRIMDAPCVSITFVKEKDPQQMLSEVFFYDSNIIISFHGDRVYKKYFEEIISSLKRRNLANP